MNVILLKMMAALITIGSDTSIDHVFVKESDSELHIIIYAYTRDKDNERIDIVIEKKDSE